MERHPIRPGRPRGAREFVAALAWTATALLIATLVRPAGSAEPRVFAARQGLDIAEAAARVWAQDAALVYVENDEPLDPQGQAQRWGYLYYSPSLDKARGYSVRNGKIVVAENLDIRIDPPPLTRGWIDSGQALAEADRGAGAQFCRDTQGRLATMLLMRGAFDDKAPDQTTWTLVYDAPHAPSLFVVIDAADGKVRKTWRG